MNTAHALSPFLAALAFGWTPAHVQDPESAATPGRITDLARRTIEAEGIEGLALLMDVGGETLFAGAWGTTHAFVESRPVTTESAWPAASLVEQFTVALVLQLVAEDELDLDDPVGKHLEGMEWEDHVVTLNHLLGHTSGITAYDRLKVGTSDDPPSQDPVQRLVGEGLESPPGSCLTYCNSNQLLLGRIVEKIEGAPLAEVIAKRILDPLEMGTSGFEAGLTEHLGVRTTRQRVAGISEVDGDGAARFGAGDLAVSTVDLMRFVRGLTGRELIDKESFGTMTGDHRCSDGTLLSYGYGLNHAPLGDIHGTSFGGAIEDHHVLAVWYPELDLAVALVADGAEPDLEALARHAARIAFGLRGPHVEDFAQTEEEIAVYAGTYMIGCNQVKLSVDDGHLAFSGVQHPDFRLLYQGRDVYVADEDHDVRLYFQVEGGRAMAFVLEQRGTRTNAMRVD